MSNTCSRRDVGAALESRKRVGHGLSGEQIVETQRTRPLGLQSEA